MSDEDEPRRRYISQVYTALQQYRDFLHSDAVVAGDFNWNIIWDKSPSSPLYGDFAETVTVLNEIGLVSSYHRISGSDCWSETDPTFFMHRKEGQTYHTDYLFAAEDVIGSIDDFYIGSYEEWIDASDHMPIIAGIDV